MSTKMLKKGDKVLLFTNYDCKGTIVITPCTVYSSGKKQTYLISDVDNRLRHNAYNTQDITGEINPLLMSGVVRRVEDLPGDTAHELAITFAKAVTDHLRAYFTRLLEQKAAQNEHYYLMSIHTDIDELHDPRIIDKRISL